MADGNLNQTVRHRAISTDQELVTFCQRSIESPFIAFDTEFVSENRYRPQLCLLQVATEGEFAIIDTLALTNIDEFWKLLVSGDHVTIAHAAREEFLFCFRAVGRRPRNLFDIQLAAGLIGHEYPAAYSNLVGKILGLQIDKGETRTDWMKRPLSTRQIEYALQDVLHLKPLYDSLVEELGSLNRTQWMTEEISNWMNVLQQSESEPQWHRVAGISGLNGRALSIVRALWIVRDEQSSQRNRSPRRVLPDDLIVELARRGSSDPKRIKAIRGFENRVSAALIQPLADAIESANALRDDELPQRLPRSKTMNLGLLGQFLTTALKIICKRENIAPGIVGSAQDIRDLAAWHMKMSPSNPRPILAEGWRAEIIGQLIEQVLDGQVAIRVENPKSSEPLTLEKIQPH